MAVRRFAPIISEASSVRLRSVRPSPSRAKEIGDDDFESVQEQCIVMR
jgi:hypothetical protein